MMPFTENGVTVHFPNEDYFFFSNCASYKKLNPFRVKEMDVCWLDKQNNMLWLVELKAFHSQDIPTFTPVDLSVQGRVDYWLNELFLKSVHTLSMLETDRSGTRSCIIDEIKADTTFKILHLINVIPGQEEYLSFMKDKLEDLLLPYTKIFNVSSVSIVPYSTARNRQLLDWIV